MLKANRYGKYLQLKEQFPFFKFEKQEFSLGTDGLHIRFSFNLADQYKFHPELFIPRKPCFLPDEEIADRLPNLIFNIGMIELISYWKAACPTKLIIEPFALFPEQVEWWKNLYFHGLGEFFYLNSMPVFPDTFIDIEVASKVNLPQQNYPMDDTLLIPVGGGKDSAVTLGIIGKNAGSLPLILNPRKACVDSITACGFDKNDFFEIRREIDPALLTLNSLGFLNGHTPFSALLGFLTVLASAITGKKNIALSNESSANEPTIPGTSINHQYSKSFGFETGFRRYVNTWIHPQINYFSFLRPLHELQIASVFSGLTEYHDVFRSCNMGSKTETWCCNCPKCLFTYIILSPFLTKEKLRKIFGKNLFEDENLLLFLNQLTGIADEKPFDCIGTIDEVNLALGETIRKHNDSVLPVLLDYYRGSAMYEQYRHQRFIQVLHGFSQHHHLLPEYEKPLRQIING